MTEKNIQKSQQGEQKETNKKELAKVANYKLIEAHTRIIKFRGAALIRNHKGYYVPMSSDAFAEIAYDHFEGISKQNISELEHKFRVKSPDMTQKGHLICFGERVWDTKKLAWVDEDPNETVFATRISPVDNTDAPWQYVMDLACGDEDLAWDILQGLAPVFMHKKPSGVIWFVGNGANGKSSLVNAMYRIIGHHLSSMTVGTIEDGRDTPRLNGVLANICRESSEGKIEDTERYKAIGTHEPFEVHKFHSQDTITVTGDVHHVFNANNIPVFSDKTEGARRRTLIIPFNNRFKDNPNFESETFTDEFLGGLITLVLQATHVIRDNRCQYRFGDVTLAAKQEYDNDVNSAEAFLEHLKENKVEAFSNYHMLQLAYQSFCQNEGLVALGVTNLRRAMRTSGNVERRSVRLDDGVKKWYFFGHAKTTPTDLVSLDNGLHIGLKAAEATPATQETFEGVKGW